MLNAIEAGSNAWLPKLPVFLRQTQQYRSTLMLTVIATEPTLPMCTNPILKKGMNHQKQLIVLNYRNTYKGYDSQYTEL